MIEVRKKEMYVRKHYTNPRFKQNNESESYGMVWWRSFFYHNVGDDDDDDYDDDDYLI